MKNALGVYTNIKVDFSKMYQNLFRIRYYNIETKYVTRGKFLGSLFRKSVLNRVFFTGEI